MSFVSYAQNFEDVMLWRALGHIENGVYVDVGAQDPDLDSVSKAFYEAGWSGINVEPVPFYAERLRAARPRDQVLQCAVSEHVGEFPLFVFEGTGLSTLTLEQAERNRSNLGLAFSESRTPTRTLRDILAPFEPDDIHWLKIDVEGAEQDVLSSWRGSDVRPWIIVVESTLPNESTEVHAAWEHLLIAAQYSFAYFDGLNRFYVSQRHSQLLEAFKAPPNVFDRFVLASEAGVRRNLDEATIYAGTLSTELANASREMARLRAEIEGTDRRNAFVEAQNYALSLEGELIAQREAYRSLEEHLRKCDAAHKEMSDALRQNFDEAERYAKSLEQELERERQRKQ